VRVHMFLHCNGGKWSAPADAGSLRTRHRLTTIEQELDVECSASAADMGTLLRENAACKSSATQAGTHTLQHHFGVVMHQAPTEPFSDHRPPSTPPTQPRP